MSRVLAILCIFTLAASHSFAADGPHSTVVGEVRDILVTESGKGPSDEGCQRFQVTPAQVSAFLHHAILISGRQEHDWFLHGPCYARGTLSSRYGEWQWELRNMGTATITSITGETFTLADPRQESSLAED